RSASGSPGQELDQFFMQLSGPGLYLRLTAPLRLTKQTKQQTQLEPRTLPGLRHILPLINTAEKPFTHSVNHPPHMSSILHDDHARLGSLLRRQRGNDGEDRKWLPVQQHLILPDKLHRLRDPSSTLLQTTGHNSRKTLHSSHTTHRPESHISPQTLHHPD